MAVETRYMVLSRIGSGTLSEPFRWNVVGATIPKQDCLLEYPDGTFLVALEGEAAQLDVVATSSIRTVVDPKAELAAQSRDTKVVDCVAATSKVTKDPGQKQAATGSKG